MTVFQLVVQSSLKKKVKTVSIALVWDDTQNAGCFVVTCKIVFK